MTESIKTLTFIGIALAVLAVAYTTSSKPLTGGDDPIVGKPLFADLEKIEAKDIRGFKIVEFVEETGKSRSLEVKQLNGRWVLPDFQNYPADAVKHLADAVKDMRGLKIDGLEGSQAGEHESFGVVEPKGSQSGDRGVGTFVSIVGDKDQSLAKLIVGKPVQKNSTTHYCRIAGQDMVYRVDVKTENWTTKFENWIENKLLKLDPNSIREIELRDYTVEQGIGAQGRPAFAFDPRSEMLMAYDGEKSAWSLARLKEFPEKNKAVEVALSEDQELNTAKLNDLKTALDDLKIVNVERKPGEMGSDVRAFIADTERAGLKSLMERGFYPFEGPNNSLDLRSSDGEIVCRMKDGVEYVLRFGELAGTTDDNSKDKAKDDAKATEGKNTDKGADKPADADKKSKSQTSRFIWVMAQVNESLIPKPQFIPFPDEKALENKPAEKEGDKPEGSVKEKGKPDPANPDSASKSPAEQEKDAAKEAALADEVKKEPAADVDPKKAADDAANVQKAKEEAHQLIEAENKKKQSDYDEKVKKAQDRVIELNKRFGNWYYVVADSEYKKIHLAKADVIKKKEKPLGQGTGVGDFHELEKGLKGIPGLSPNPTPEK